MARKFFDIGAWLESGAGEATATPPKTPKEALAERYGYSPERGREQRAAFRHMMEQRKVRQQEEAREQETEQEFRDLGVIPEQEEPQVRRSTRDRRPPKRFGFDE